MNQAGCWAEMKRVPSTQVHDLCTSAALHEVTSPNSPQGGGPKVFQKLPYCVLADLKCFQEQLGFVLPWSLFQSFSLPSVSLLCTSEMMAFTWVCFMEGIGRRLEIKEKPSAHLATL